MDILLFVLGAIYVSGMIVTLVSSLIDYSVAIHSFRLYENGHSKQRAARDIVNSERRMSLAWAWPYLVYQFAQRGSKDSQLAKEYLKNEF